MRILPSYDQKKLRSYKKKTPFIPIVRWRLIGRTRYTDDIENHSTIIYFNLYNLSP